MLTPKPVVLLDVDGVLADILESLLREINIKTDLCVTKQDVTDWDIFECLKNNKYDIKSICIECFAQPNFAYALKPYEDAISGVTTLQQIADVHILTMPFDSPTWIHDRNRWLKKYFNISPDKIIYAHNKHMINGDIFVDDRPYFVDMWKKFHPAKLGFLWSQAYNKTHQTNFRIESWNDLISVVRQFNS